MRIIMGAQACGFGPVAKLVAIARLLENKDKVFVGDGIALEFARRNSSCFSQLIPCEPVALPSLQSLITEIDFGLVVMHHELAFWIVQFGRPLYFFDSLFGFWILRHGIETLLNAAKKIRRIKPETAHKLFQTFSVHEQKMICHLLARRSFVQNFAGIPNRVEELRRCGIQHIEIIGSIVDINAPPNTPQISESPDISQAARGDGWEILINLGGVKNFILDFHHNDYYIDVLERWARDFLLQRSDCRRITLCCGRYTEPRIEQVGDSLLHCELLPHARFIEAVQRATVYLSSPGLTAINEAVRLGRLPLLLPEQHYSQFYNLEALRGTKLGELALRNSDLFDNYSVPAHDYRGSQVIIDYTKKLHDSDQAYARFRRLLCDRVEQMLNLDQETQKLALSEMQQMLAGPDLASVVHKLLTDVQQQLRK